MGSSRGELRASEMRMAAARHDLRYLLSFALMS
jgi:hypothetical protein